MLPSANQLYAMNDFEKNYYYTINQKKKKKNAGKESGALAHIGAHNMHKLLISIPCTSFGEFGVGTKGGLRILAMYDTRLDVRV